MIFVRFLSEASGNLVGFVILKGKDITGTSVRERIGLGIGYVPVDRYRDAMVGDMTLAENMMLKTSFDRTWTRHGFLNRKKLYDHTQKAIEDFEIKAPGPDAQIRDGFLLCTRWYPPI